MIGRSGSSADDSVCRLSTLLFVPCPDTGSCGYARNLSDIITDFFKIEFIPCKFLLRVYQRFRELCPVILTGIHHDHADFDALDLPRVASNRRPSSSENRLPITQNTRRYRSLTLFVREKIVCHRSSSVIDENQPAASEDWRFYCFISRIHRHFSLSYPLNIVPDTHILFQITIPNATFRFSYTDDENTI